MTHPYLLFFSKQNGNLTNSPELSKYLDDTAHRHINTDSDSEVLINILANNLQEFNKVRINQDDFFKALEGLNNRCLGGYACTGLITGSGVFGFRDPHGIRPLVYGSRKCDKGIDYMIASESVALEALGFTVIRDVSPGEAILITKDGVIHTKVCFSQKITVRALQKMPAN